MPDAHGDDTGDPPLRIRVLLAALTVVLLVVGLSWDSAPGIVTGVLLGVPVVYLLTEVAVFVRGLTRSSPEA